jgi:hypothetical protein
MSEQDVLVIGGALLVGAGLVALYQYLRPEGDVVVGRVTVAQESRVRVVDADIARQAVTNRARLAQEKADREANEAALAAAVAKQEQNQAAIVEAETEWRHEVQRQSESGRINLGRNLSGPVDVDETLYYPGMETFH